VAITVLVWWFSWRSILSYLYVSVSIKIADSARKDWGILRPQGSRDAPLHELVVVASAMTARMSGIIGTQEGVNVVEGLIGEVGAGHVWEQETVGLLG